MTEAVLAVLGRQALLLSLSLVLVMALRPLVLKRWGALASYTAWLLVPALLLTPALPRPSQEPLAVLLTLSSAAAPSATVATPIATPVWPGLLLGLWLLGTLAVLIELSRRQLKLRGPVLPAGASPALVGLLRPRVLLPLDFEARFRPEERALILAHEAVHRARGDNAWRALAWGLAALHWWNPLAWAALRRLQADQELACDAAVLRQRPGCTATYTRALLAAHGLRSPGAPLASRWGSTHPLIERIAMLD